jgi:hypothetical protein
MVNSRKKFTIDTFTQNINEINCKISLSHQRPFPSLYLLSDYNFKKRSVKILPNGDIEGGYAKMVTSLIDFSFIRSLVAHRYTIKAPPPYDPPSIFLADLFRHMEGFKHMNQFLKVVRSEKRGAAYREYAGFTDRVPCEGTFSNFRKRLGETLYSDIFHALVDIFHQLEMITFNILAHDGTLYETHARYKGCTYFCGQCQEIKVPNIIEKVRNRILYRLKKANENNLGSEIRVYAPCPSENFPEKNHKGREIKRPRVELFTCKLAFSNGNLSTAQRNTAILFRVNDELERQDLCIETLRSNITDIDPDDGSITISCPKLPKDTDARIGVRRNPKNPNKKEKIFGYNLVLSTSVELQLKLELPVAATNIAGNAEEGSQIIENREQVYRHHEADVKVDIADAKYDILKNYHYIREKGSIPIIDYNRRNEDLSKTAILKRGYDINGWPFAPCGLLARPNGFDETHRRLTFCCHKSCLKLNKTSMENLNASYNISQCPHIHNRTGFTRHMSIKDYPRLINEIPRGSKRYKVIKNLRSASERANSTIKEDIKILEKPRVLNRVRANILAQMAGITLLLKRVLSFVVKTTIQFA